MQSAPLLQGARDLGAACPGLGLMGEAGEDTVLAVGHSGPRGRDRAGRFLEPLRELSGDPWGRPLWGVPLTGSSLGGCPRPGTVHTGAQSSLLGVRSWDGPSQLTCQVCVSPRFQVAG